ncbi:MAG TPA: hypothetical protein VE860_08780, partial [Chthoniobacterales bacterium]|nr:hypothetical protein [Chthoniobacterales bacterium]
GSSITGRSRKDHGERWRLRARQGAGTGALSLQAAALGASVTAIDLSSAMRRELRVLLAREAQRWIEEDVPAGRTANVHLALARRSDRSL